METITFELGEIVHKPSYTEDTQRYTEDTQLLKTSHTRLLLRILETIDKRSARMLEGRTMDDSELEKLIVVGIISLKAEKSKLETRLNESFELYRQDRIDLFSITRR